MRRAIASSLLRGVHAAESTAGARLYSSKPITATLFPGDGESL